MLTDYHLHLRPDDLDARARDHFTEDNIARYRAVADERGIAELGVSEHVYRFEQALDVWRHPFWQENARDDLDAYCEFVRSRSDLRLGIEADFVPGGEDRMANLLDERDFDYVLGSIHFLREDSIDMDDYSVWDRGHSPQEILAALFPDACRGCTQRPVRHPRSPRPGQDMEPRRPHQPGAAAAGGRSAPLLRAGDRSDRRSGDRRRGLHLRPAQARARAVPRGVVP